MRSLLAVIALGLLVCACTGVLIHYHLSIKEKIEAVQKELEDVSEMTTYWFSNGQQKCWKSTMREGESIEDFVQRHEKEVGIAQKACPPNPPTSK